jgi:hypothetical protein
MIVYNILEVIYPIMMWAFIVVACLSLLKFIGLVLYGFWLEIFGK